MSFRKLNISKIQKKRFYIQLKLGEKVPKHCWGQKNISLCYNTNYPFLEGIADISITLKLMLDRF